MFFQIEKLIIWPKNDKYVPREVAFEIGKVNVITGASRTGKTAIIPIIDYCLGSGTCSIPIDIIRDYVSWYGIVVRTSSETLLLARKVPNGNQVSYEYYVSRNIPANIPSTLTSNNNLDGVKYILDTISGLHYIRNEEEPNGFNERLSFRDLTHLVFQSQEIIANQNIIFYKTHRSEHREKLKNWLPYILGAETIEILIARQQLKKVEKELKRLQLEYDNATQVSHDWLNDLSGHLQIAKEYGLYTKDIPFDNQLDKLLEIAKEIANKDFDFPYSSTETINTTVEEINRLKNEEDKISQDIGIIKKRLNDISRLKSSLSDYQNGAQRRVDRLGLSQWLRENALPAKPCPICGEISHPLANAEIDKICNALSRYECIANSQTDIPAAFSREFILLQEQLQNKLSEQAELHQRERLLWSQNEEAMKYHQRSKEMYIFLGQLKYTVSLISRLSDGGDIEEKINEYKERQIELSKQVSSVNVKYLTDRALQKIGVLTLKYLQMLDVEEIYTKTTPIFSITEFGIQVMGGDGVSHLLSEVGSASNWVSFHVAFTCALQEYFIGCTHPISPVPSFVFYDQPSQVYFPKVKTDKDEEESPYKDEDIEAVKSIFRTIAKSVLSTKGQWQAIILDHARSDIYEDIEGVVEVEEWRNGNKLIPDFWIDSNENK